MSTTSTSGWNRSTSTPKPAPKKPSAMRGVVAGLVVVALAIVGVAIYHFTDADAKKPIRGEVKRGLIGGAKATAKKRAEVSNEASSATNMTEKAAKDSGAAVSNKLDFASMSAKEAARYGYYKSAERLKGVHKRVFDTDSEEYLSGVLCTKPGTMILDVPLPKNFDEEIKKSLLQPAVPFSDDDDDYNRARKQAMRDARKTLAEAVAAGESIAEMTKATVKELRKIAEIRDNVVQGYVELRNKGAGQEEIWDYIEAGNKLLDRYDAQHLLTPLGLKKRIELEKLDVNESAD